MERDVKITGYGAWFLGQLVIFLTDLTFFYSVQSKIKFLAEENNLILAF